MIIDQIIFKIVDKYLKKFDTEILTFNCKIINVNKKFKHPYTYIKVLKNINY